MLDVVFTNPWVRALGLILILAVIAVLVYLLSPVLVPLFFAFIVAYVLDPVVDFFEKRKISRTVTIAVLALLSLVLLISIPLIVLPGLIHQADALVTGAGIDQESALARWAGQAVDRLPLESLARAAGWVEEGEQFDARVVLAERIGGFIKNNAVELLQAHGAQAARAGQRAGSTIAGLFSSVGRGVVGILLFLGNFALFAFVTGYLLRDYDRIVAAAGELVPPRHRAKTFEIMGKIDHQIQGFLRGQLLVCLCLAVMYAVGLTVAGTPFSIVLGVFGGFISFVPYLGPALMILPASLLTLLQHGADGHILACLGTFVIAQTIEGNFLTPNIVGDKVGLSPVWVILAILVFSSALGFLGLLLAVPIAACLKVFVVEAVEYYKDSPVFRGKDSGSPSSSG